MKDFQGNKLHVGDKIFFALTSFEAVRVATITRFTSKYVYFKQDNTIKPAIEERRFPNSIIKYKKDVTHE